LAKNPSGYCNHRYRFKGWPELWATVSKL
jgi:hypothetical protein